MGFNVTKFVFLLIITCFVTCKASKSKEIDLNVVQMAHNMVVQANNWAQLSAHDESSLIFGHHRRGSGGGHAGLADNDTMTTYSSLGGHENDSTLEDNLIFGHHRHHRRHHGGGGGGGHGGLANIDDTMTIDISQGGHENDTTLGSNLIFGHHRHHRRHHGGGGGGGHGGLADTGDTATTDSQGGHENDTTLESNLIFGHHRHHRRCHGGGGGGHGGLTGDDPMTVDSQGGRDNDTTLDSNLIFGHHRHGRRHHGGGGGGGRDGLTDNDSITNNGRDDESIYNNTMFLGDGHHDEHHHGGHHGSRDDETYDETKIFGRGGGGGGGGHHGGGRGGHHGGGGHDDDDSIYANTMNFGRGGGGGVHDGGGRGGHHGGGGHDDDDDSTYDDELIFGFGRGSGSGGGHHGSSHGGGGGHHGGGGHGGALLNSTYNEINNTIDNNNYNNQRLALIDCAKLYDLAKSLLTRVIDNNGNYTSQDALAWLSGALTSHRTCLDGLKERGMNEDDHPLAQNLTMVLNDALALHAKKLEAMDNTPNGAPGKPRGDQYRGLLPSWNMATARADVVVAKDGSGKYRTINKAVNALGRMTNRRGGRRVVVHVKAGVYDEHVEIGRNLRDVMFVGEGIDKTIVTGHRNYIDGDTTVSSATFRVFGDGFWARDMTFENTAGPQKHQAVALMVASDNALFYRCSIKGYQDTLYAHSLRQFYRDCKIYGTIDFIFGNAAVVFQNCDILVRRPMNNKANMITAQGRDNPYENTGISIHGSRIIPAPEFVPVKGSINTFLGRPSKKYSRTVIAKTDLDGMIHLKGWTEWEGNFALSTLYYGEYMNTGLGASTRGRVNWPGYHVLMSPREVGPFTVRNFIQGDSWVMKTGVPVWTEI